MTVHKFLSKHDSEIPFIKTHLPITETLWDVLALQAIMLRTEIGWIG